MSEENGTTADPEVTTEKTKKQLTLPVRLHSRIADNAEAGGYESLVAYLRGAVLLEETVRQATSAGSKVVLRAADGTETVLCILM